MNGHFLCLRFYERKKKKSQMCCRDKKLRGECYFGEIKCLTRELEQNVKFERPNSTVNALRFFKLMHF